MAMMSINYVPATWELSDLTIVSLTLRIFWVKRNGQIHLMQLTAADQLHPASSPCFKRGRNIASAAPTA